MIRHRLRRYANAVYLTRHALSAGGVMVPRRNNVLCVVRPEFGRGAPRLHAAHNIVTNDGDTYYAQVIAQETPTNAFGRLFLSSVDFAPAPGKATDAGDLASVIAGGDRDPDATYPQTVDPDVDNTGDGVDIVTYRYSYSAGDFTDADIDAGAIAVVGTTWGAGADPLLNAFDLATFGKTASDTLKVFVNHELTGV